MRCPIVKLNKKGVKNYLGNRLWFSFQEIFQFEKIKNQIKPGSIVNVLSEDNFFLGCGYFNPNSYYSLKLLTKKNVIIDQNFFLKRFSKALKLKRSIYPHESCFRLIFSEGDFLPGLIVDIYEKVAVVQIYTLGIENLKNFIIDALKNLLNLQAIVLKNDFPKRKEEELELYTEIAYGKTEEIILVEMDEIKFLVPLLKGQKTGFFLDQRENRRFLKNLAKGCTILDGFSYTGAFSFYALKGGAKIAFLVDRHIYTEDYLLKKITVLLGGRVSEEIVFNKISSGAQDDLKKATQIAKKMVCNWGMSKKIGPVAFGKSEEHIFLGKEMFQIKDFSEETARIIDEEIKNIITSCYEKAKAILTAYLNKLHKVAHTLLEEETLDADRFKFLLNES